MVQAGESRFRWTIWQRVFTLALLAIAVCAVAPATSAAFVSGQQEAWTVLQGNGQSDPTHIEIHNPLQLAVNPNDGSVYIGNLAGNNATMRVQKFSQAGTILGVTEDIPATGSIIGIGLNPAAGSAGHFYVILGSKRTEEPLEGLFVAEKIREYSTVPNGSGELVKEAEFSLPSVSPTGGGEALVTPREIDVDPVTGELVVLALNESNQIILQRINGTTGAFTSRHTETGTTIGGTGAPTNLFYGMAVNNSGLTYIVTTEGNGGAQSSIRGYTLKSNFNTATLESVPGFANAAAAESWPSVGGNRIIIEPLVGSKQGKGPQIAVGTNASGEETIYYKTLVTASTSTKAGVYYIHGYSIPGEATSTIFGGNTVGGACAIQTGSAALAARNDGTLDVLDQGKTVTSEAELSPYGPNVLRFGPNGGVSCPVPAAALELKESGTKVSTVAAGTTVTLDGSASELAGKTLTETTWTIKGPVESTANIAGPTNSTTKEFNTPGTYTVREKIETAALTGLGTTYSAQPQTLVVTGGGPAAPTVTGLSPTHGSTAGGNQVEILGTELSGATKVEFGTTSVTSFAEDTATSIKLNAPAHAAGEVDVTVTTAGGTSATGASDKYTYDVPAPAVSSVSPNHGTTLGSETITIEGTNLGSPTGVSFGGTAGTNVTEVNPTKLTVKSPVHAAGEVDVTVTTAGGTSATGANDKFTFEAPGAPAPTCSAFTPNKGPIVGGTAVTLSGTNLSSATKVEFGTTAVTSFTEDTATTIKVNTPAHAAGPITVKVTTAGGTATCAGGEFTFDVPAPAVSSVSPNHGTTLGSETITIEGTNLGSPTGVSFGGTAGSNVTEVSATKLTVKSPAHAAGQIDVTVTTAGGTSATGTPDKFTYQIPAPTVTSVSPNRGSTAGGEVITIEGTNLGSPTGVSFGGTAGSNVTEVSATKLTVKSPVHAAGEVDVTVTTAGGTSATGANDKFTFQTPVPAVTSVAPNHGTTAGGETITIEGTNLTSVNGVSFGGVGANEIREVSATKMTVKSPAHVAGQVDVVVQTTLGTSATGAADKYTYESPAAITHTLSVTMAGTGSGAVTCNGAACAASYTQGAEVTLAASPASGSTFAGWSGASCTGTGACKVTITADTAVTATFNATPSNNPRSNGGGGSGGGSNNTPKPPDNTATPGAVKPSGTSATMMLTVPGPGAIVVSGKGLVGAKYHAKGAGPVQLKLVLTSAEKKQLAKTGKVTIKVKIVYTPTGGSPGVTTKTITFKAKTAGKGAARVLSRMLAPGF